MTDERKKLRGKESSLCGARIYTETFYKTSTEEKQSPSSEKQSKVGAKMNYRNVEGVKEMKAVFKNE